MVFGAGSRSVCRRFRFCGLPRCGCAERLPLVMLALGLATQQAIAEVSALAPDLRWPNDVLLGGKKCAGILAQIGWRRDHCRDRHQRRAREFPAGYPRTRDLARAWRVARVFARRAAGALLAKAIDEHLDLLAQRWPGGDSRYVHARVELRFGPPRAGGPAGRHYRRNHMRAGPVRLPARKAG